MNTWSHIHVNCHQMVPLRVCSNGPYDGGRGCFNTLVLLTVDRAAMNKWCHIHVNFHTKVTLRVCAVVHTMVDEAVFLFGCWSIRWWTSLDFDAWSIRWWTNWVCDQTKVSSLVTHLKQLFSQLVTLCTWYACYLKQNAIYERVYLVKIATGTLA